MTLRLAPYNDAMRLGQGFNSYTHELCIDGAVKVSQRHGKPIVTTSPSQVVSYSARFVEKLSDVVESMNVSYSSAIKKGTIEISGNTSTVDENTFKSSDLNAVVAVKVVNQTISIEDESKFQPISSTATFDSSRFNEIYGDSYVSGFIEGGDFTGIVSIKIVDRKDVGSKLRTIKTVLNTNSKSEVEEFVLGPSNDSNQSSLATALEDTQTTISISWMGGAQIKEPTQPWDIDSMYAAAAAFPAAVAQCPQRTWAILTPYKANRSFIKWCTENPVKTLQYDLISSYTAELFDSFMDYKLLLKQIQSIIHNRQDYRQRLGVADAIDTNIRTLLSVRGALRDEQTKIVEAIEILSKDPSILKRQAAWSTTNRSPLVKQIIQKALGSAAEWQPTTLPSVVAASVPMPESMAISPSQIGQPIAPSGALEQPADGTAQPQRTASDARISEPLHSDGDEGILVDSAGQSSQAIADESEDLQAVRTEEDTPEISKPRDSNLAAGPQNVTEGRITSQQTANVTIRPESSCPKQEQVPSAAAPYAGIPSKPELEFNFDTLIPPEVWEDLLPERVNTEAFSQGGFTQTGFVPQASGVSSLLNPFIPPPDGSSGPGVIVSQSYDAMQRELEAARKEKAAAEQNAADAEAARAKQSQEFAALNAQFTQYKSEAEATKSNSASQLNFQLEAVSKKDAEIERLKAESRNISGERDSAQRERDNYSNEINRLKNYMLNGMTDSDIVIITITYGTGIYYEVGHTNDNYGLLPKIHQLIRSNNQFHVDDGWVGHDPNYGLIKTLVVTYRYNKPGYEKRVRTLTAKQYEWARFDAF